MSPIAPVYSLQRVSRIWHKENILSPADSLSCGGRAENPGRPRQLGFLGQDTKDMRAAQRENSRGLRSRSWVHSWVLVNTGMEENSMRLKEAPPRRTRGYSAWHSYRLEIVPVPTSHTGNLKNPCTFDKIQRRALPYS